MEFNEPAVLNAAVQLVDALASKKNLRQLPDGTGGKLDRSAARTHRLLAARLRTKGEATWHEELNEAVSGVFAVGGEEDWETLLEHALVNAGTVVLEWLTDLKIRKEKVNELASANSQGNGNKAQ